MRDSGGSSGHAPAPPNPVTANMAVAELNSNGSVTAPLLAITKAVPSSEDVQPFLDKASDEGLEILRSPTLVFSNVHLVDLIKYAQAIQRGSSMYIRALTGCAKSRIQSTSRPNGVRML